MATGPVLPAGAPFRRLPIIGIQFFHALQTMYLQVLLKLLHFLLQGAPLLLYLLNLGAVRVQILHYLRIWPRTLGG